MDENAEITRVNFNLPDEVHRRSIAAAKGKGWNFTQFVVFAIGLAIRVIEETAKGNRIYLQTPNGEARELLFPW